MSPLARRLVPSLLLLPLLSIAARAQDAAPREVFPPGVEDLPIGLTPEERALMGTIGSFSTITPPPTGPVRAAAEWDESNGVFCLWPNASLFAALQQNDDVYIITQDSNWWLSWLSSNGIPTTNVHFLSEPTNTWWVRDYGPWFVWDGNDDFGLVDNVYNRPRPLDDVIPEAIAQTYGVPYYGMDLIHTGGNYYADGFGNGWSTQLPYKENPNLSDDDVDARMHDYLGITRYVTRDIDYDIEHFDTFGKLLAPDTLLWGEFPQDSTPWAYCEGALDYYRTLQSPYGWPYKVHRIPLWQQGSSWTAYINSLMSDGTLLVPRYGTAHDQEAEAIYEAAVPGYQVALVAAAGTTWGDSVHCRSRNFVRGDAVRIYPQPHWESCDDDLNPYVVAAEVVPHPSTALAGRPEIHWSTTGGAPFQVELMLPTGNPHEYSGSIPAMPHGTTISYYLHAEDLAGTVKNAPFVAPAGTFTIRVEEDATPPLVDHDAIHGWSPGDWPATVTCTAIDNTGIPSVTLHYGINGTPQPPIALVKEEGRFVFSGAMGGTAADGDVIAYRIEAVDGASPANTTFVPSFGWSYFVVSDVQPVLVLDLDTTPDSGPFLADVCDDLGLCTEYATEWPSNLGDYSAVLLCLGMKPTHTKLSTPEANALVSYLNAGGAVYMEGGNCWAQDSTSGIVRPWFGLQGASSGSDLLAPLLGDDRAFTAGMSFAYEGERTSSDHLTPVQTASVLLTSQSSVKAVAWSTGTYEAIAASFQIDGLIDGDAPSRAKYVAARYLDGLGQEVDLVAHTDPLDPTDVTVFLQGDAGAGFLLLSAYGPGYAPLGPAGVLAIDKATVRVLDTGALPTSGEVELQLAMPYDPSLSGSEVYFQAYVEDTATGLYVLTNRDRIVVELP